MKINTAEVGLVVIQAGNQADPGPVSASAVSKGCLRLQGPNDYGFFAAESSGESFSIIRSGQYWVLRAGDLCGNIRTFMADFIREKKVVVSVSPSNQAVNIDFY